MINLLTQDMGVPSSCPGQLEPVSQDRHNQECVPYWTKPIELHHRADQGDDAQDAPARAGDDAMGFPAPGKVREAVGAERDEVQASEVQAAAPYSSTDEKDRDGNGNCITASKDGGSEARIPVHRSFPRTSGGCRRRRTCPTNTGPLLEPGIYGALRHDISREGSLTLGRSRTGAAAFRRRP